MCWKACPVWLGAVLLCEKGIATLDELAQHRPIRPPAKMLATMAPTPVHRFSENRIECSCMCSVLHLCHGTICRGSRWPNACSMQWRPHGGA